VSGRTIVVAGAGIGGLTAALALARQGFRVEVLDQAACLEETGAGIQLSPNATRILLELGLRDRLAPAAVAPDAIVVRNARDRVISRMALDASERRYGAPYWVVHRGDLQGALHGAVMARRDIALTLGAAVDRYAVDAGGVTVRATRNGRSEEVRGAALVGADGLWSTLRVLAGETEAPTFAGRSAWRALVPADAVAPDVRAPVVNLRLGEDAHLVHYPVRGGAMINLVAIAADARPSTGWSTVATADEVLARFPASVWAASARDLLALPAQWLKWPLYERRPLRPREGESAGAAVTLIGDAAHPMLPYLAQGAAMAIEDAAVLAHALAATPDELAGAMRRYETVRRPRIARVRDAVRRNDAVYHLGGAAAALRDGAMGLMGGRLLHSRFDWLYEWRPE